MNSALQPKIFFRALCTPVVGFGLSYFYLGKSCRFAVFLWALTWAAVLRVHIRTTRHPEQAQLPCCQRLFDILCYCSWLRFCFVVLAICNKGLESAAP
jgi:hypothetical protein